MTHDMLFTASENHRNSQQQSSYMWNICVPSIPDICHERQEYIRVNFFWPVYIFTDLTQKIDNLLCILP